MIDYFSLGHPLAALRTRYALKARRRMFQLFLDAFHPSAATRVLDLGVTPDESLPESNFFEKLYPYREHLTVASIEDASAIEHNFPGVTFVRIAPGALPFADREFDIVFVPRCSSTWAAARPSARSSPKPCAWASRFFSPRRTVCSRSTSTPCCR
ncbi:MAG: hypothetical protein WDN04_21420 [Rhodospirillales bacterium]